MEREHERFDNWIWNLENHRFLTRRIYKLKEHLTVEEWQAVEELMEAKHWGDAERKQGKEIVETAVWFNQLQAPVHDTDDSINAEP